MKVVVLLLFYGFSITHAMGADSQLDKHSEVDECLLKALKQAAAEQTVGELRESCIEIAPTLFKQY